MLTVDSMMFTVDSMTLTVDSMMHTVESMMFALDSMMFTLDSMMFILDSTMLTFVYDWVVSPALLVLIKSTDNCRGRNKWLRFYYPPAELRIFLQLLQYLASIC